MQDCISKYFAAIMMTGVLISLIFRFIGKEKLAMAILLIPFYCILFLLYPKCALIVVPISCAFVVFIFYLEKKRDEKWENRRKQR